jgi:hypothetical protein
MAIYPDVWCHDSDRICVWGHLDSIARGKEDIEAQYEGWVAVEEHVHAVNDVG